MANLFQASIYGRNSNAVGTAQGKTLAFPSQSVWVQPAPAHTTFNGVTVNSIIQLIPSGTVVTQPQWYSDRTVAQISTLANA